MTVMDTGVLVIGAVSVIASQLCHADLRQFALLFSPDSPWLSRDGSTTAASPLAKAPPARSIKPTA